MQIGHRLSEDLDFCKWKKSRTDTPTINLTEIERHIESHIKEKNLLDFNQVNYNLEKNVKLSFYANQLYKSPVKNKVFIEKNIVAADIESLGVMKLELMLRRSNFRDYYDIYAILQEGISIKDMVSSVGIYTNHRLKSKNILMFISNGTNYKYEKDFEYLMPKYKVNEKDIENYIRKCINKEYNN